MKSSDNKHEQVEGKGEETTHVFPTVTTPKPESNTSSEHAALTELIEKNIKWAQVIYNQNKKIQRRLSWMVFGSYFKLFLILVPLILGIIYLPPILSDFFTQYKQVFGGGNHTFSDYLEILKQTQ